MARTERKTPDGRAIYQCDSCGDVSPWQEPWVWYGSYRQLEDDSASILTFCEPECVERYRQTQFSNGIEPLPIYAPPSQGEQ